MPELSDEQLASMRRLGRPTIGVTRRQSIAIRVDTRVLEQFRKAAKLRGVGYQTLINQVLAQHAPKAS